MSNKINKITVTNQKISGRGGITLFLRYIEQIHFYRLISRIFSTLQIFHPKGLQLLQFVKQMFAFFIDGTDMNITSFNRRKSDESYAAVLENSIEEMASSHQIKRFFKKLSIMPNALFRKILRTLFVWRLLNTKPRVIELWLDTMVMNNNDAEKREGCEPTYKPIKGFQPLHVKWGRYLIDVIFRKGSAHSNHGTDYIDTVRDIVLLIRKKYDSDVPIIINTDSGFFDQKAFDYFEDVLKIHWVTTGKFYTASKEGVQAIKEINSALIKEEQSSLFNQYKNGKQVWDYVEFGSKLISWKKYRRCIYTQLSTDNQGQYLLDFHPTDNLIYTNIGIDKELDKKLYGTDADKYFTSAGLIGFSHSKGKDELIHRSLKELATKEQLPFKKFEMNQVYYYLLVITHFLFETYKEDIAYNSISIASYPNTFRRNLIDFAAKIVSHSGYIIMQVTKSIYNNLNISKIWEKCQIPPLIIVGKMMA